VKQYYGAMEKVLDDMMSVAGKWEERRRTTFNKTQFVQMESRVGKMMRDAVNDMVEAGGGYL